MSISRFRGARLQKQLKPYASAANRFRIAVERHEARVATHTSIQSWIGGLQLIVGLITTLVLIYVAYLQYSASERQVALEYAKVAPIFSIQSEMTGDEFNPDVLYLPTKLRIVLHRGEANIKRIESYQDIEISILPNNSRKSYFCTLRIDNFFRPDSNNSNLQSIGALKKYMNEAKFFFPDFPGDFAIITPKNTWLKVVYVDIFGRDQQAIFGGQRGRLNLIPSKSLGGDAFGEIAVTQFRKGTLTFPKMWTRSQGPFKTEGCKHILDELQR